MKLLTQELLSKLPARYSQENVKDPLCIVKFFCPWNQWTWYGIEFDPEDRLFFGYVIGHEKEIGYFSLDELEKVRHKTGLKIERDLHFKPQKLSEIRKYYKDLKDLD